jgi:hypothetical protein
MSTTATDNPYSRQNDAENDLQEFLEANLQQKWAGEYDRLRNLPLFFRQKDLAHVLFMSDIYRRILEVPGYIAEFGVMWGRNLNLFHCLRETLEPYNHTRRLLGFDTFTGFLPDAAKEAGAVTSRPGLHDTGAYSVAAGHRGLLSELLVRQEAVSHLSHLRRFDLIQGDVEETLPAFLTEKQHAFFALCYLDLDLYKPTKAVLSAISTRLVRGSILVFDEMLNPDYPGETQAVSELMGLRQISLRRDPISGWKTYCVVD